MITMSSEGNGMGNCIDRSFLGTSNNSLRFDTIGQKGMKKIKKNPPKKVQLLISKQGPTGVNAWVVKCDRDRHD